LFTFADRRSKMIQQSLLLSVGLLLAGCSIHQNVTAVPKLTNNELCIIQNPDVRESFLDAYQRALEGKNLKTRVLPQTATPRDCPQASTYTANWRWDLALYLAFVDINIFQDGKSVGRAVYDSLGGGGNLSKFIDAEKKINELVDLLFPTVLPSDANHAPTQ
jgi:hypothetical protein